MRIGIVLVVMRSILVTVAVRSAQVAMSGLFDVIIKFAKK